MHPFKVCLHEILHIHFFSRVIFPLSSIKSFSSVPQQAIVVYIHFPSCFCADNAFWAPCLVLPISHIWIVPNHPEILDITIYVGAAPLNITSIVAYLATWIHGDLWISWRLWRTIYIISGTRERWSGYLSLVMGISFVKMVTLVEKTARWNVAIIAALPIKISWACHYAMLKLGTEEVSYYMLCIVCLAQKQFLICV